MQTVAAVVAAHRELPRAVVLWGRDDLRHAVVGHHPYHVALVFDNGADAGTEESVRHVKQGYETALLVVDADTR